MTKPRHKLPDGRFRLGDEDRDALCRMVPEHLRDGLVRWVEEGLLPGDFLLAVLTNNLRESVGRADRYSLEALPQLVIWLHNFAPAAVWGSHERVQIYAQWCERLRAIWRLQDCEDAELYQEHVAPGDDASGPTVGTTLTEAGIRFAKQHKLTVSRDGRGAWFCQEAVDARLRDLGLEPEQAR